MIKFRALRADEIEVKVKQVKEKGCVALLYKTARTDMDLLDETLGAERWDCDYKTIKDNLYCGISVKTVPDESQSWVTKWDCGIESREDDEGNQKKGEASDAFKRAGFKWGIGRELYTSPFIWIPSTACEIKPNSKGGYGCYDKFSVQSIEHSEDGKRITGLVIYNDTKKTTAFVWKEPKPSNDGISARDKLMYCLKNRGIDINEYAKEHGLTKETTEETFIKLLLELNKGEQ